MVSCVICGVYYCVYDIYSAPRLFPVRVATFMYYHTLRIFVSTVSRPTSTNFFFNVVDPPLYSVSRCLLSSSRFFLHVLIRFLFFWFCPLFFLLITGVSSYLHFLSTPRSFFMLRAWLVLHFSHLPLLLPACFP